MKFSEISYSFRCAALTRFSKAYSIEEQRCETLRTGDSPRRRGALARCFPRRPARGAGAAAAARRAPSCLAYMV